MDIPQLHLRGVRLPGAAGDLQRRGSTASLIRELGDNYETYHAFLEAELDRLGGPPDPSAYSSFDDYAAAWGRLEAVVHAEVSLRRCRGMRKAGTRLDAAVAPDAVLVGPDNRLRRG